MSRGRENERNYKEQIEKRERGRKNKNRRTERKGSEKE
jgi:hypothetical protein